MSPRYSRPKSALLANLARRGRVRPLMFDGTPVGSIDLTEDFHPLRADGSPEGRLWVFGVVTEGVRYFTLYVPSPKSRVRAFVDAEICAKEVLRLDRAALGAAPVAAHEPGPYGAGRSDRRRGAPPWR